MSQTAPIAGAGRSGADVRQAIAQAAQRTGVDFQYLLAQAQIESSLDPSARAATSSAAGLYQFTKGTWLAMLDRHGADHGLGWAAAAIDGGQVSDPGARAQLLALRYDPQLSSLMAAELAGDNAAALQGVLGRQPDAAELYLAHFLGAEGASRLLTALQADPAQSAAALLPRAAAANRGIFYAKGGAPRSVGAVMDLLRAKVTRGMDAASGDAPLPPRPLSDAPAFAAGAGLGSGAASLPRPASLPARPSMAETLRTTFALGANDTATPAHVRAAYGKLRAFGL